MKITGEKIAKDKYKKQIQKKYGIKPLVAKPKKNKPSNYDLDKDGVSNQKDCNPYDPEKQDFARGYTKPRTYRGYNIDKYYYSQGEYHLLPGAEPEDKKGILSRMFKK